MMQRKKAILKDCFMNSGKKKLMLWVTAICLLFLVLCPGGRVKASADLLPKPSYNLNIGLRSTSELVDTGSGYMRVFYDGTKVCIEYYDNEFHILSSRSVAMELELWGGFYAGADAYYLAEGQDNPEENDGAEVIRVIKYDKNWNRLGAASIKGKTDFFGGEVRYPFNVGCVEMAEHDGTLYLVTGHEGYVDPAYNQGHQGFLFIAVDTDSMHGEIVDCDLWHSFAQYIKVAGEELYVLEKSEGSRCTKVTRYDAQTLKSTMIEVLPYGGSPTSAWAIACYASVDDLAVSSDHVLCLGTSIDQSQYDNVSEDTAHNIYLTVTPMADFSKEATTVKWLTDYSGGGKSFLGTKLTKINDNRLMVSWEESEEEQPGSTEDCLAGNLLHYLFIDGQGNKISEEYTAPAPISDCHPIVKDGKAVYCASNGNMVNFYSIDTQTGQFTKEVYRVAGEHASWECKDGVLTISGTGPISVDPKARHRYPVSSASGWSSYSFSDNAWKPVREQVEKIVIEGGITEIPPEEFAYFNKLEEVEIASGLKSIGDKAFYRCEALTKITIPASVTSIGEDILWTGYYWVGDKSHVVKAAIYTEPGSYAEAYAKKNGLSYSINGKDIIWGDEDDNSITIKGKKDISTAVVSGIQEKYPYKGKDLTHTVTVKQKGKTLKQGTDYKVSYANNRNTGRAVVTIKGINNYSGTIRKTFLIVPKKASVSKLSSPKKRTIKVSWKKDAQASGYELQYAANAKFTKGKKTVILPKKSMVSKKIAGLTKGRKYCVRMRAYKKIDGKKYYGAWSKVKKIKVR